ncbi:hypothetical protein R1sor_004374 [Riccia sorocarpa]|uniref:Glutaredoxin domain-containing protein n=1 Tax=Riccia sorocarpa TaxID=122646 RepID=A0ABD3HGI0_9MARC
MAWVGGASATIRAVVPATYISGSVQSPEFAAACRNSPRRIGLVPSCLSSPISFSTYRGNVRNFRAALLPSILYSCSRSWSTPSLLGSSNSQLGGAGFRGRLLVQEGRRLLNNTLIVRCMSEQSETGIEDMIRSKNEENAVVVYSKSWCPYCARAKGLFKELGVECLVIELNEIVEEQEVQDALRRLTGQSTVPNIFIGGKHIGGCDNTFELHKRGKLLPLLTAAGVTVSNA